MLSGKIDKLKMTKVFKELDKNGDGKIGKHEFVLGVNKLAQEHMGHSISEVILHNVFHDVIDNF